MLPKYQDLDDVTKYINKNSLELIDIVDSIFDINEETVQSVFDSIVQRASNFSGNKETITAEFNDLIEKYHIDGLKNIITSHIKNINPQEDLNYILNCINYAMNIRFKQRDSLKTLFHYITNHFQIDREIEQPQDITENKFMKIFQEDDVEAFIKEMSEANFKSNHRVTVSLSINDSINTSVSFMQLMAFCGAKSCFKYAIIDGSFQYDDISIYAIAGGNKEIIKILDQNNISFDNCILTAVQYHRQDICNWLLNSHFEDCQNIEVKQAQKYYNDKFSYFLIKNNINIGKFAGALKMAASTDNCNFINYLIGDRLVKRNDNVDDALKYAIKNNSFNSLKVILESLNTTLDNSYITYKAAKKGNLNVFKCLKEFKKLDTSENYYRKGTVFEIICSRGYVDVYKFLVGENSLIMNHDFNKDLYSACKKCNLDFIKYLIEEFHINVKQISQRALSIAYENDNLELIKYFYDQCHANVNEKGTVKMTLLHDASEKGKIKLVKYLVEVCNANVDEKDNNGMTPLHIASKNGNLELVKYLVEECHANIDETMIEIIEISEPGLSLGGNINSGVGLSLGRNINSRLNLSLGGNINSGVGLSLGRNINSGLNLSLGNKTNPGPGLHPGKNYIVKTSLRLASENGYLQLVKYFIETCHASFSDEDFINSNDVIRNYFKTRCSFYKECEEGNITRIKMLIDNEHCDVNQKYNGRTALHIAAEKENIELINFLLETCHANIEEKDKFGRTVLHNASIKGNLELVKYLVETCHANVEEKVKRLGLSLGGISNGRTPLHIASENGNFELVKYLVEECHANVEEKDSNEITALYIASEKGNFEIIKYLVEECHANVETISKRALRIAGEKCDLELAKYLVERCHVNVDEKEEERNIKIGLRLAPKRISNGGTVLHNASENGNLELVKYLVKECHANVEEKDSNERTALHIACENGNLELVKCLVKECHANVEEKDSNGRTALYIASIKANLEIVKYLIDECNADVKIKVSEAPIPPSNVNSLKLKPLSLGLQPSNTSNVKSKLSLGLQPSNTSNVKPKLSLGLQPSNTSNVKPKLSLGLQSSNTSNVKPLKLNLSLKK